jgi:Tol biopolymer transport system component
VQLSPDGGSIAYVVSNRERPGRPYSQIWIATAATGEARRLVGESEAGSGPRWSPDGQWIAYFGSDGNRSGILIRKADGSGTKLVAEVQGSNHPVPGTGERLTWAPDSRRIAFVSATPGPEPSSAGAAADPIVITRYLYRTTGADGSSYFSDNRRLHLFVADIAMRPSCTGRAGRRTDAWSRTRGRDAD